MLIRRYEPSDREVVRRVHAEAFRRLDAPDVIPVEVTLFDQLIGGGDVVHELSLVAVDRDEVVGHVVCSRATVGASRAVGLGPIGVFPAHQGRGVGLALMHAVLGAADALDFPLVGLLGSTAYYARFGFVPATTLGIEPPDPQWGDLFQIRVLTSYDPAATGTFRYAQAFDMV
jgi:putative acetyltransferase